MNKSPADIAKAVAMLAALGLVVIVATKAVSKVGTKAVEKL